MRYIIEYKYKGKEWGRSGNKSMGSGENLLNKDFTNLEEAQREVEYQNWEMNRFGSGDYKYRVTQVEGGNMRIGEHEVKAVSKNEAQVGCQKVTREQALELIKVLDGYQEGVRGMTVKGHGSGSDYLNLSIRCENDGYMAGYTDKNKPFVGPWTTQVVHMSIYKDQAEMLYNFLKEKLGK